MMAESTENLVQAAIGILGNPDLSDDDIEHQVGELAQDAMLARRLIDVIPEAFGLIFVSHFKSAETMELPSTFSAKDAQGDLAKLSLQKGTHFHSGCTGSAGHVPQWPAPNFPDRHRPELDTGDRQQGAQPKRLERRLVPCGCPPWRPELFRHSGRNLQRQLKHEAPHPDTGINPVLPRWKAVRF